MIKILDDWMSCGIIKIGGLVRNKEHRRRKIRNLLDSTALVFWDQNENFAYPLLVQEMAPDRQTVHAQVCALKIVALVYIRLKYLYIGLRV